MDNPAAGTGASVRFAPDRRVTWAAVAGAVVLAVLLLLASDGPSRLLFGVGVVVLLAFAVSDVVFAPRVVASAGGVDVRSPLLRASLPWERIEVVRVDTRARLGLRSETLEIDAGETLAVLSRRALGAEPGAAATAINAFRPPIDYPAT